MRVRVGVDKLDGYHNCSIEELEKFSDNELSYIFCDCILEKDTYNNYKKNIGLIISKLRLNGTLNIVGIDIHSLCFECMSMNNIERFNNAISDSKCILSYKNIEEELKSKGIRIKSISLNGLYYNIEAVR